MEFEKIGSVSIKAEIVTHKDKVIYEAEDNNGNLYVLKVFQKTHKYPLYESLAKLAHENMTQIHGVQMHEDCFYVLEEHINGHTLKHKLETDGALSKQETVNILMQLCDVLTYLHSQSPPIIHRDITPNNIMIADNGIVKLLDFDIAREYKNEKSADTEHVGTRPFAPPEQYGFAQSDHRADIYALGMLTTVMLTNTYDMQRIADLHIKQIVARCMQISPDKRFQNAKKLKDKLNQVSNKKAMPTKIIATFATAFIAAIVAIAVFMQISPNEAGFDAPNFVNVQDPQLPVYSGWMVWVNVSGGFSEDGINAVMQHLDAENFEVLITSDPPAYDTFLILESRNAPPPFEEFIFTPVEVHLDPSNRVDRLVTVTIAYLDFEETITFPVTSYAATNMPDVVIVDFASPDGAEAITLTSAAVRRYAEQGQALQIILLQGTVLLDWDAVNSIGQLASGVSVEFRIVQHGDDLEFVVTSGDQVLADIQGDIRIVQPIAVD